MCRDCGHRFSETSVLSTNLNNRNERQVCATLAEAKNLTKVKPLRSGLAGATKLDKLEVRGQIAEYLWHLQKQGLRPSTIEHYGQKLRQLLRFKVNLLDPEQVKTCLARNNKWSERTKAIFATIYDGFAKFLDIQWELPRYTAVRKLPFIPTEQEIDAFISACGKKLATFMQLLKETGMRCGEASKTEWTDLDFQRNVVKVTPEKGSNPRILPISEKLVGMLKNLPKQSNNVFPAQLRSMKANLYITRKGIARKLNNPRLLKISFHNLRHWKGTTEYHKTKDVIHVQNVLGHRDIKSTMVYITLENALFHSKNEEFHVKTAKTVEEACELVESGFEYVTAIDGIQVFRKRK